MPRVKLEFDCHLSTSFRTGEIHLLFKHMGSISMIAALFSNSQAAEPWVDVIPHSVDVCLFFLNGQSAEVERGISRSILKTFRIQIEPGTCFLRCECPGVAQKCPRVKKVEPWPRPGIHLDLQSGSIFWTFSLPGVISRCVFFPMCGQKGFKCFFVGLFQLPGATDMRK